MNEAIRHWRTLANSFPSLSQMIAIGRLPADYAPETLLGYCEYAAISRLERSVFSFLLHVWGQYDFDFTLSDTLLWDDGNRLAFVAWANGCTLGQPFRYF